MEKTRQELKQIAISVLNEMGIYLPFVKRLDKKDEITMFISGIGYSIDEETEDNLFSVIKRIEKDGEHVVYAVTKNMNSDGDRVYALLVVTEEDSGVDTVIDRYEQDDIPAYRVFAYLYYPECDDYNGWSYVKVQNRYGGVRRIG